MRDRHRARISPNLSPLSIGERRREGKGDRAGTERKKRDGARKEQRKNVSAKNLWMNNSVSRSEATSCSFAARVSASLASIRAKVTTRHELSLHPKYRPRLFFAPFCPPPNVGKKYRCRLSRFRFFEFLFRIQLRFLIGKKKEKKLFSKISLQIHLLIFQHAILQYSTRKVSEEGSARGSFSFRSNEKITGTIFVYFSSAATRRTAFKLRFHG